MNFIRLPVAWNAVQTEPGAPNYNKVISDSCPRSDEGYEAQHVLHVYWSLSWFPFFSSVCGFYLFDESDPHRISGRSSHLIHHSFCFQASVCSSRSQEHLKGITSKLEMKLIYLIIFVDLKPKSGSLWHHISLTVKLRDFFNIRHKAETPKCGIFAAETSYYFLYE